MKRRNTPAKQTILNILNSSESALSQDTIEQEINGSMDRVTIYRILNSFCEDGYVHKIISDNGKQYFALCKNCGKEKHVHNHFHFRCLKCQKIECMQEEVKFSIPTGYKLEDINCLLTGYCPSCS